MGAVLSGLLGFMRSHFSQEEDLMRRYGYKGLESHTQTHRMLFERLAELTGETFNKKGKTDILIKEDNYNLFICECKFWSGPKKLEQTIQQLFDYKTWRDSKTAILLFNKHVKPSTILEKINPTLLAHPNFKSEYSFIRDKLKNEEIVFGYIFSHPEDKKREFHLSIILFNII